VLTNRFSDGEGWVILNGTEAAIKAKVAAIGTPLKEWGIQINYGIKTGYNEAFIIDKTTKAEIIKKSPKSASIIRPILRGRDIQKFYAIPTELSLLFIPWHFPIHERKDIVGASVKAEAEFQRKYPSILSHLNKHKNELRRRNKSETGIRYEWYALQRYGSNYWKEFEKPKVVWKRIGSVIRFSYDDSGAFCLDSTCFATGSDIKYLVGVLNSSISKRLLLDNAPKTGTGDIIISVQALEPLLVPKASEKVKGEIVKLVDQCVEILSNDTSADIRGLEKKIDNIVFDMYGFTEEERAFIVGSLTSSPIHHQTD
jgi:hypothetical protein